MSQQPDLVSKVSFFPVEDRTGENKALIVTIKNVIPEGPDLWRSMETPIKRSTSVDSNKRRVKTSRALSEKAKSKSTMTETSAAVSFSTQTSELVQDPVPSASSEEHTHPDSNVCLKHAAQNISSKASHIPSEKISLCNNCSKSMLSYIFLVQDFLDSLAKEICGDTDTKKCVQCLRQENRLSISSRSEETVAKTERKSSKSRGKSNSDRKTEISSKQTDDSRIGKTSPKVGPREVRKYEETAEKLIQRSLSEHQQEHQKHYHDSSNPQDGSSHSSEGQRAQPQIRDQDHWQTQQGSNGQQGRYQSHEGPGGQQSSHQSHEGPGGQQGRHEEHPGSSYPQHGYENIPQSGEHQGGSSRQNPDAPQHEQSALYQGNNQESNWSTQEDTRFRKQMDRQQPDFTETSYRQEHKGGESSNQESFHNVESVSSPFSDGMDGIVTTLSNAEREVYDAARNGAGWDSLSEPQERLISSSTNQIPSEAFVTMCRNNAEAIGCLVVGTSLLLCRTTRTLCVVVSDGVSTAFRGALSSVFHVVQCVRSMDSLGTTKLALLEQPELGISFEKLNVWRLLQFNKCVYLNPDTLVIQNCDELFCHNELSAVPDIGWPDCFNSGVFVFVPSTQTFWQLLEFAENQGSYDGGDQGLLNSYFNNWSDDINKKLSFIYNLMANVSYTYTPAYKQFGRNVKIVQFHGSFKPWHVKFFTRTGQISPASAVHPTYVQFVHIWINIFRISALRQLSQEIQSYALKQEVICAVELLRFFPLPTESEAEFYLSPPSVRLKLVERKLQRTAKISEEAKRRKSAEFTPLPDRDEGFESHVHTATEEVSSTLAIETPAPDESEAKPEAGASETAEKAEADAPKIKTVKSLLPGAEVGNYQGMKAWEQGRMDYQGTDSSETIIKRLQFLMDRPK